MNMRKFNICEGQFGKECHKYEVQHSWLCGQLFYDSILRIGIYWLRKKNFKNLFQKKKEASLHHQVLIFWSSFGISQFNATLGLEIRKQ